MTPDQIAAVIEQKRMIHPELSSPLHWPGLRQILTREGVLLARAPLDRSAQLVPYDGVWVLLINADAPARRHTYFAAHELGHLWLHVEHGHERWEHCYHMATDWPDDPREDDAELFAQMVLGLV